MSNHDEGDQTDGIGTPEPAPASASRPDMPASEIELRLRRDIARFREQARSAQAERDATIASIRADNDAKLIRAELRVAAIRSGIIDVDALRLVDASSLRVGPDGSIEGAEDAVAGLKTSKPYLFEEKRSFAPDAFTTSQPRRPPAPAQPDPVDARTLTRDQWQAERAKVLSRHR